MGGVMDNEINEMDKKFLFNFSNDEITGENNLFWNRFTAFSAIQAGLFAFASNGNTPKVKVFGIIFAFVWFLIQLLSCYHEGKHRPLRDRLGRELKITWLDGSNKPCWQKVNIAWLSLCVPILLIFFWLI
jgi:hypothetical protein